MKSAPSRSRHLLAILLALFAGPAASAATFRVAPAGNDASPGTEQQPLATLAAARDAARRAGVGPHRIVVAPGDYYLEKTVQFDARDNGLTVEAGPEGKAVLYGGRVVSGWRPDGDTFWGADLPGVTEGNWDFRALIVNGRMAERARLPAKGTFLHLSKFDVPWLSSVGGGWARKPTPAELVTLRYDPKDIPATLVARNAEVRVYHMWDESLVGVANHDPALYTFTFSPPAKSPPGAFGVKKYVVFNTREGLTQPGQWYLDRAAGRVVYWPLPGEDMATAKVIAPVLERIIGVGGTEKAPVERFTLRGLALQATTTPLKPGGFGAGAFDGALTVERAKACAFEKLEISNVAGQGILAKELVDCQIRACHVHHAGACGIRASGSAVLVEGNHLHHVGLHHPSAIVLAIGRPARAVGEKGFHVYRNEIHDAPYSGITGNGSDHLIEENLISRVMLELHDGGAIYGGMRKSTLRGNLVRDVVKMGEGYGVSAYYLDEGAEDCVVERNVSIGVERPTHNHIARGIVIRDNTFIAEGNMTLSFQRSSDCTLTGNLLFAPGKITVSPPNAIKEWSRNVVYRGGAEAGAVPQAFAIDAAMPAAPAPARRTSPVQVQRAPQPPVLDGEIGWEEWPAGQLSIERESSRWTGRGAPVFARLGYDEHNLYVAVNVVLFDVAKLRQGTAWGTDDGVEISLAGAEGAFVLRGFADGKVQSVTVAGAPAAAAERVGRAVRFVALPYGKTKDDWKSGWRMEWAIPFEAIGVKSAPGLKIPFNLAIYRSEDGVSRSLEGTLAESWRLDQAATLQLK